MDENTHELKRAKIISKIKEMRLMDDDFMTAVLSDNHRPHDKRNGG